MNLLTQNFEAFTVWKDSAMQSLVDTWTAFAGTDVKPPALLVVFLLGFITKFGFDVYLTWRRGKRVAGGA